MGGGAHGRPSARATRTGTTNTCIRIAGMVHVGGEPTVHARQKNAASVKMTTMTAPTTSLVIVPQNRPTAAPEPASKLGNSGRPAQRSPSASR